MTKSILTEKLIWPPQDQQKYCSLLTAAETKLPVLRNILEELAVQVLSERAPYNITIIPRHAPKTLGTEGLDFDNREIKIIVTNSVYGITRCLIPQLWMISVKQAKNMTSWDYFKKNYTPEQLVKLYAEENIEAFIKFSQIIYKYFLENEKEISSVNFEDYSYHQIVEKFKKLTVKSAYDNYPKAFSNLYYQHYQDLYDEYIKNQADEYIKNQADEYIKNQADEYIKNPVIEFKEGIDTSEIQDYSYEKEQDNYQTIVSGADSSNSNNTII